MPGADSQPLPPTKASKSGITVNDAGERVIASSTRADGSVRKEIRVRPGYRPPEDVEVYKNATAEAWKNKGKGGVPGAEALSSPDKPTAAANKNAKRREARKKAAAAATDGDKVEGDKKDEAALSTQPTDAEAEKEKEARKLNKKLRQARELKDKKDQGAALLPEQFQKVIQINELIRQLDNLGFDSNGEKKNDVP